MPSSFDFSHAPFDCLTPAERQRVVDTVDIGYFPAGTVILDPEMAATHVHVLIKGHVQHVEAGALLAVLEDSDFRLARQRARAAQANYQAQLDQARSKLAQQSSLIAASQAEVAASQATLERAQLDLGRAQALRKPGTVGRVVPGGTLRIVDEQGRDVKQGEVGEIYVRGPHLAEFTYNNDDAKRREVALGARACAH